MLKTIITFIFIFGLIVIGHEFGHYYVAKKSGILVREFAIGMGPKLLSFRRNGTTYTWRLLPIGGYVRMAGNGEDEEDLQKGMPVMLNLDDNGVVTRINTSKKTLFDGIPLEVTDFDLEDKLCITGNVMGDEDDVQTFPVSHDATLIEEDGTEIVIAPKDVQFQSVSLPKRIMTNLAGPVNNFLLAIILFMIVAFLQGGVPKSTAEIGQVQKNSVAYEAGLKSHMVVKKVDEKSVQTWQELSNAIQNNKGTLTLQVQEGKKTKTLKMTPKTEKVDGKERQLIGITPAYDTSILAKVKYGFTATLHNSLAVFQALGDLLQGFSLDKLGGPVAIFKMSETAANSGWIYILSFTALLSVNLGIMNLLPIPALDGGKLVLNLYEAICGRPMDPKKEGILTIIGFSCVLLLMILVTWNDLRRYFF